MDCYVTENPEKLKPVLEKHIRKKEHVLLCFPETGDALGCMLAEAVREYGGVGVSMGRDFLWKSLLRKAFSERCSTVVGDPEIILGLGKLAKRQGVPLYIRKAVLVGELPDEWVLESIRTTLDCQVLACCSISQSEHADEVIEKLDRELRRWTTILDFRLERMGAGLSLEMVTFPGEKLPRLPSFAKLIVREWNPDQDCPFAIPIRWKNVINS